MRFSVLTLFPEFFESPLKSSLLGRAQADGTLRVDCLNLREFGEGKYRAVDDKPYGGGAGMVLMPTVLERALEQLLGGAAAVDRLENDVRARRTPVAGSTGSGPDGAQQLPYVISLSPQGRRLDAGLARRLASQPYLALICGHYEGVDERAVEAFAHDEVSIGDYVLTGGEPAALVLIDTVARFIGGVVGEAASVEGDTFESPTEMVPGGLKAPSFTRPAEWRGRRIPEVLISGNHGEIAKWRKSQSEARTRSRRPDLLKSK